jgi:hypothetical protein
MSPREETVLTRKITGITWGVIITITTITGGVMSMGFKAYTNILYAIERNNSDYRQVQEQIKAMGSDMNRHEKQLEYLMRTKKD